MTVTKERKEQIDSIIEELRKLWYYYDPLRLGQLLESLKIFPTETFFDCKMRCFRDTPSIFSQEDDKTLEAINLVISKYEKEHQIL